MAMNSVQKPLRVFISYSHDSPSHEEAVLALADQLRADGVDAILDQYEVAPPDGWPRWMDRNLRESDFVLIVCTETYLRRGRGDEKPGSGHGVRWEAHMTYQQLYDAGSRNDRFIPVLLDGGDPAHIPEPLRGYAYYRLEQPWRLDRMGGYEALYRHLTGQPRITRPVLGTLTSMPPRAPQPNGKGTTHSQAEAIACAPAASPLRAVIITEVLKLMEELVSRRPNTCEKRSSGCPGLYRAYVAMEAFICKNEEFVIKLGQAPAAQGDFAALFATYGELVSSLEELIGQLSRHIRRLRIFDPDIAKNLDNVLGIKSTRLRFWLEVLNQNGQKLLVASELFQLAHLHSPSGRYFYHDDAVEIAKQLEFVGTVSLQDRQVVAGLVREAETLVSEFRSVHRQLAEFIKANCSYADLVSDG